MVWWRPSLAEVRPGLVTWHWVIVAVILVSVLLLVALLSFWRLLSVMWWFYEWVGIVLFAVVLVPVIIEQAYSAARKRRTEPYCIHCGYRLEGLPDHHQCPECGRPYSFELIREYQQNPDWFVERWKRGQTVGRESSSSPGRDR